MGFVPQLVDMNGDGLTDILSGSYFGDVRSGQIVRDENGKQLSEIFVYYRRADGGFDQRIRIATCHIHSVASPVDWDGDGDFDLITADRSAHGILLMRNIGDRTAPQFEKPVPLLTTMSERLGKDLMITSAEAFDWDGDGLRDLVAGTEWGQIIWFRNTGTADAPVFGAEPAFLVGTTTAGLTLEQKVEMLGRLPWGSRFEICIVDYDGDGTSDILAGDSKTEDLSESSLRPEDRPEYERVKARMAEAKQKQSELLRGVDFAKATPEEQQKLRAAMSAIQSEYGADQQKYYRDFYKTAHHGMVWVFRGIPAKN